MQFSSFTENISIAQLSNVIKSNLQFSVFCTDRKVSNQQKKTYWELVDFIYWTISFSLNNESQHNSQVSPKHKVKLNIVKDYWGDWLARIVEQRSHRHLFSNRKDVKFNCFRLDSSECQGGFGLIFRFFNVIGQFARLLAGDKNLPVAVRWTPNIHLLHIQHFSRPWNRRLCCPFWCPLDATHLWSYDSFNPNLSGTKIV